MFYTNTDACSDAPNAVWVTKDGCAIQSCFDENGDTRTTECKSEYLAATKESFSVLPIGYQVTGTCETGYVVSEWLTEPYPYNGMFYFIATLAEDGTAKLEFFKTSDCSASDSISNDRAAKNTVETASCVSADVNSIMYLGTGPYTQWYSSNIYDDGGLSTEIIAGIVCGCVVFLLLVAGMLFYRRKSKRKNGGQWTATLPSGDLTSLEAAMTGQMGLWNDDVITAKRIPRDKVKVKKLLSRGACGEVYNGVFNGQRVAVKLLLPSTSGNLQHVKDFLTEAKLTASMDHPHIVTFAGVA